MKLCINCRNYHRLETRDYCTHQHNQSPVDGSKEFIECRDMRQASGSCGIEARLFENKYLAVPKISNQN